MMYNMYDMKKKKEIAHQATKLNAESGCVSGLPRRKSLRKLLLTRRTLFFVWSQISLFPATATRTLKAMRSRWLLVSQTLLTNFARSGEQKRARDITRCYDGDALIINDPINRHYRNDAPRWYQSRQRI